MTAGAPALTALLDELDRLRAAAGTDTPWRVGQHYGIHVYGGPDEQSPVATCHWDADAEFAVAAVNALPRLTAAVRAALALADELDAISDEHYAAYKHGDPSDTRRGSPYTEGFCVGYDSAAERLRSDIAAALGATP